MAMFYPLYTCFLHQLRSNEPASDDIADRSPTDRFVTMRTTRPMMAMKLFQYPKGEMYISNSASRRGNSSRRPRFSGV